MSAYPGHMFSSEGMEPWPHKISAVKEWNIPTSVSVLHSFLGLACYYRRYIQGFADITAPLHHLTSNGVTFHCNTAGWSCHSLRQLCPVLFKAQLQHYIEECPAVVYALKQFRHNWDDTSSCSLTIPRCYCYQPKRWRVCSLVGPWLYRSVPSWHSTGRGNTMGMLIHYLCGHSQTVTVQFLLSATNREDIRQHQQDDPIISGIRNALHAPQHPHHRAKHGTSPRCPIIPMWPQVKMRDGIVYQNYTPGPSSVSVTVFLFSVALQPCAVAE